MFLDAAKNEGLSEKSFDAYLRIVFGQTFGTSHNELSIILELSYRSIETPGGLKYHFFEFFYIPFYCLLIFISTTIDKSKWSRIHSHK